MSHLFVDISGHGLGHLAQTAPVLNALRTTRPGLRLTIRSAIPRQRLAQRITGEFIHIQEAADFGFTMANALDVDRSASAARYQAFHADWEDKVAAEADRLARLAPDVVLANVAYLPLAGAARAGIAAVALCSLNWADLFHHYFGHEPWGAAIHGQMRTAYESAALFLRITPGMPVAHFGNEAVIGPIAQQAVAAGRSRVELAAHLDIPVDHRWVLVGLGGFDFRLPVADWHRPVDVHWLIPAAWGTTAPGIRAFDGPGASYVELMDHADAVITKSGYGAFAEAALRRQPVVYLRRPDWPEEPWLLAWLNAHGRAGEMSRNQGSGVGPAALLEDLWSRPAPPPPPPTGIAEAVAQLRRLLG